MNSHFNSIETMDPLYGLNRNIILEFYDSHFLAFDVNTNNVLTFVLPLTFESFVQYNQILKNYEEYKLNQLNLIIQDFQKKNYTLNSFIIDIANNNIKKHNDLISISRSIMNNDSVPNKYIQKKDNLTDFQSIIEKQFILQMNNIHSQIYHPNFQFILQQQLAQKQYEQELLFNTIYQNIQIDNELKEDDLVQRLENELKEDDLAQRLEHEFKENEVNDVIENEFKENDLAQRLEHEFKENELKENELKENDLAQRLENEFKENEVNDVIENDLKEDDLAQRLEHEIKEDDLAQSLEHELKESLEEDNSNNYWVQRVKNKEINIVETNKKETKKNKNEGYLFNTKLNKYFSNNYELLTSIKFDILHKNINDKRFDNRVISFKRHLTNQINFSKNIENDIIVENYRIHLYVEKPSKFIYEVDYKESYIDDENHILTLKNSIENKKGNQIDLIKKVCLTRMNLKKTKDIQPYVLHFSNQSSKILKNHLDNIFTWINNNREFNMDFYDINHNENKKKYICIHHRNSNSYSNFLDIIYSQNNPLSSDMILIWY